MPLVMILWYQIIHDIRFLDEVITITLQIMSHNILYQDFDNIKEFTQKTQTL